MLPGWRHGDRRFTHPANQYGRQVNTVCRPTNGGAGQMSKWYMIHASSLTLWCFNVIQEQDV